MSSFRSLCACKDLLRFRYAISIDSSAITSDSAEAHLAICILSSSIKSQGMLVLSLSDCKQSCHCLSCVPLGILLACRGLQYNGCYTVSQHMGLCQTRTGKPCTPGRAFPFGSAQPLATSQQHAQLSPWTSGAASSVMSQVFSLLGDRLLHLIIAAKQCHWLVIHACCPSEHRHSFHAYHSFRLRWSPVPYISHSKPCISPGALIQLSGHTSPQVPVLAAMRFTRTLSCKLASWWLLLMQDWARPSQAWR